MALGATGKLLPPVVARLLADSSEFSAKIDEATRKVVEFGRTRADAKVTATIAEFTAKIDEAKRELLTLDAEGERAVVLRANIADYEAKMAAVRAENTATHQTFGRLASVGRTALLGVAGAAVAVGYESIKMGGEFQQATNVLVTAAGESQRNLGLVRSGILDIARTTGTTWQNLADGMYLVEKAGYRGAQGLTVLRAAAQGAREENASLADVTNAMTSVMASYHLGAGKSVQVMNALKTAAGEGKMTMEEFAGSLSTVIPVASANNISLAQVTGAVATLTQHGTSAREATQELANTIRSLSAPNRVAQNEMQQLGLSVNDVSKNLGKRGLTGTLDLLVNAITSHMGPAGLVLQNTFNQSKSAAADAQTMFDRLSPAAQKVADAYRHGSIGLKEYRTEMKALPGPMGNLLQEWLSLQNKAQGFNSLLRAGDPAAQTFTAALKQMTGGATGMNTTLMLTGANMAGFNERVQRVQHSLDDNAKSVEGWNSTSKLTSVVLDGVKQTAESYAISLGSVLGPALSNTIRFFERHSDVAKTLAGVIGGTLTVVIAAYTAKVVESVAKTTDSFLKDAQTAAKWVAERVLGTQTVTGAVVTGAAEQDAALEGTSAVATETGAATTLAMGPIILAVAAVGVAAYELYKHWDTVWGGIKSIAETVWTGGIRPVFDALRSAADAVWAVMDTAWHGIDDVIHFVGDHIVEIAKIIIAVALGPIGIAIDILWTHWRTVWNAIKDVTGAVWSALKPVFGAIVGAGLTVIRTAVDGLKAVWDTAWSVIHGVVSTAWSIIKPIFDAVVGVGLHFIRDEITGLQRIWDGVWSGLHTVVEGAWSIIKPILDTMGAALHGIADAISTVTGGISKIAGGAGHVLGGVAHFIGLADGGIVTRPTLAMVGEGGGPEAVLPLNNPARAAEILAQARAFLPNLSMLAPMNGGAGPAAGTSGLGGGAVSIDARIINPQFHGTGQQMLSQFQALVEANNAELVRSLRAL